MSKINIKYISDGALETIKQNLDYVAEKLTENPNSSSWLSELYDGQLYVTKTFEIEDFVLKQPIDERDKETDFQNSVLLYERLNKLPKYVLTDERFWCWINFEKGYQAALKYMPVNGKSTVVQDHWLFTQGKRRGLFFGVLSRCFFRVALTVDTSLDDPYELSRFVVEKPSRFRELSWRAFSSEKTIVLGAVKAEKKIIDANPQLNEKANYYTEIAKELSKLSSVKLLDSIQEKDIEMFVYAVYSSLIEEEKRTDD